MAWLTTHQYVTLKIQNEKGIILNTSAANEHVSNMERNNRTIKERVRAGWSRLPYKKCMSNIITRHLVTKKLCGLLTFIEKGVEVNLYLLEC